MNSSHVHKIDSQLNSTMRIISGTLKSTPTPWLPVLSNIPPSTIRRKAALKREWDKYKLLPNNYPISIDLENPPQHRLKSRKPIWRGRFLVEHLSINDLWKQEWSSVDISNKELIEDPTTAVPGFDLPRAIWSKLNRIRTRHGRCNSMLYRWGAIPSPDCSCGNGTETMEHIVNECPITKFDGGFAGIHKVTPNVIEWLQSLKDL